MAQDGSDRRVLCIASSETTKIVSDVVAQRGVGPLMTACTMEEALALVRRHTWLAVVAALGTQPSDLLFDGGGDDRSSLIAAAKALDPAPLVVVFSWTACRRPDFAQACHDAGADAVVNTAEALAEAIADYEAAAAVARLPDSDETGTQDTPAGDDDSGLLPMYNSPEEYPVIAHRLRWEASLIQAFGEHHETLTRYRYTTRILMQMVSVLPMPLTLPETSSRRGTSSTDGAGRPVRVVHVSDTHHHHSRVRLPAGDVLVHTGDLVGNYGDRDIEKHLADFQEWLVECSAHYRLVVFIGGNHDTLLDPPKGKVAKNFLASLPANVRYLLNSGVDFEGVRIWGSPVTVCRRETLGKNYISNAFERPAAERQRVWQEIPEGLDLLLTHAPPVGTLCHREIGCKLLQRRLASMTAPPRYHCFGHDHDHYGVQAGTFTVSFNSAQEQLLRQERGTEGCAWVFDIARS